MAGPPYSSEALERRLTRYRERVEGVLDRALAPGDAGTARLLEAMRYSTLGGGKRLRPILVYSAGQALGAPLEALDPVAAAVELIHVYSLVHDDLPAMDDDDLRRGRPTCHRAFDEATAILAGDALQALAFELLAGGSTAAGGGSGNAAPAAAQVAAQLDMVRLLAGAIGTHGMAGGQAIDLGAVGCTLGLEALELMHRRKTGALIQASVLLGALAAGERAGTRFEALRRFGAQVGLAFQIQDDILDVAGTTEALGKVAGADAARNKPTYPSLIGLDASRARAAALCEEAIAALAPLGGAAADLAELARFVVRRES